MTSAPSCDTLIRAGILVTQDAERRILHDAGIAIADGRIAAIGPWADVKSAFRPASTMDLADCMVLPGLVNCHTHAAMTAFRGLADDLPLMRWLEGSIWPVESRLSPEIVHSGSLVACAEMIRTGTTCFTDMYLFETETAQAVERMGMRAVLGEGILGFPTPAYTDASRALAIAGELTEVTAGSALVRTGIAPHAVYTNSPETLRESFALAKRLNVPWMIHLAENAEETARCMEATGKRPVAYLHDLGCLSPRSVLVHCVDLTEDDISLIAASGAHVVHNPRSNMKLASGIAPVPALQRAGVNVCLGTDGAASNNTLNLFREMNACALLHKVAHGDPTAMPAPAVLDMTTANAARALGWDGIGVITPGSAADIIAMPLDEPGLCPVYTPFSHAVYAAGGHEVCLNMVAGRVIYERGSFTNIEIEELRDHARKLAEWVGTDGKSKTQN
ncbi:5-methylthioadenosine/S-adenosylhomocysteine deaminase [Desulfobaculum xiamenense]|uniref:5-methylthioadenosine/S-adenosylhomocysteine deaminase n=1 Tax=Desulfobaculum xiamenense TaxID=995050 RepID=A0A846QKM9_9BACT|nr:amidohydrolase [Desulfobaculum xiamenense]NJB66743.1 5-methylthioadenosine/S-adenosylhomocysteine deaminase [Desulfobaculum xiamenense]